MRGDGAPDRVAHEEIHLLPSSNTSVSARFVESGTLMEAPTGLTAPSITIKPSTFWDPLKAGDWIFPEKTSMR